MSDKILVVVESPAKAKTITKYLGRGFQVLSSMGHVVDLPKSRLAVNVENNFEPDYITIRGRGKLLDSLKKSANKSKVVLLASDNDREGEAISWHIQNAILKSNPKVKFKRIVFNEITKDAIKESIKNPIIIDMHKVNAQKARRVLDRLVGYNLSPLLWQKLKKGLSAGRVQSATLKLICDREDAILSFIPQEYWNIEGTFSKDKKKFKVKLQEYNGKKIDLKNEKDTNAVVAKLKKEKFIVSKVAKKDRKRKPLAPFTTSKLQQEAFNSLRFKADKTMWTAQRLYEGIDLKKETVGLITYMRTDSTRVSDVAIKEVRDYILKVYGKKYLPSKPIHYTNKKGAQDAHEAIRPTSVLRTPKDVSPYLSKDELKLYTLIWNKFLASQMEDAIYDQLQVDITGGKGLFKLILSEVKFKGFLEVLGISNGDNINLPKLAKGDEVKLNKLDQTQHFTEPPPRYTEASIVKKLEETGIGRPGTYAPTIFTLAKRHYITRTNKSFTPTELGKLTNKLISEYFPDITNVDFTAKMEELLDEIEEAKIDWIKILKDFYPTFSKTVKLASEKMESMKNIFDKETDEICEKCGNSMIKRLGRYGYFLACSGFPECKNSKPIPICNCPENACNGKIVEKKAKRRKFYGCSNYPDCKFISWDAPSEESCPKCNEVLFEKFTKAKGRVLTCKNEKCKYERIPKKKST